MTGRLSRRDALLRTAGLAAAGMFPFAPLPGFAAPVRKPVHSGEIDAVLQAKVAAREIPGIVAMADGSVAQPVNLARGYELNAIAAAANRSSALH